jgi:hypothetical protein
MCTGKLVPKSHVPFMNGPTTFVTMGSINHINDRVQGLDRLMQLLRYPWRHELIIFHERVHR